MTFKLIESLEKATPYMLRNDGKLIKCIEYHPYISAVYKDKETDLESLVQERLSELKWFYDNTKYESTKKLIQIIYKSALSMNKAFPGEEKYFNLSDKIYTAKNNEIYSFLEQLTNETNQEFCRVRTSDLKYGGDSNDIYFRISSIGFNWFNLIWSLVEDYPEISTVTISRDLTANNYNRGKCYIVKGIEINHLSRNDFLLLPGNPIIENYNFEMDLMNESLDKLNKGYSIEDSLPKVHPRYLNDYFNTIKIKQLDKDFNLV